MYTVQTQKWQIGRMSGYYSVNRNVLSRVRKYLRASSRKCSAANNGTVNRMLDEAVAAGTAKSSATWKVGNVSERAKVRRCTAVEDLVYEYGNLGSWT